MPSKPRPLIPDPCFLPSVVTFGCRLNTYESEVMRQHAVAAGLADAVIVNTCAVTGEAERQARQAIRKIRREKPNAKIIVTGCAAQVNPDMFAAMEEVDYVIGNDIKMQPESYRLLEGERIRVSDIQKVRDAAAHLVQGFEGKSRAFVQVQNGCDHRCTFCIIPYGRGPSRSVPVDVIVEQVRTLAAQGYREMALTGVDITSYGADLPEEVSLGQMIRRVLDRVPDVPRLRLSSLDPVEVDEDLWRLIADEPRLMPHLHISMQAGDDMVLKRMKRRHTPADIIRFCERARSLRSGIAFGADIIAGFPTETDEMFANTLRLVEECGITWLHVFPYSARSGTPAARMPQVKGETRRARAAELRALGENAVQKHLDALIGQRLDVLVEKPELGRTPTFAEARLLAPAPVGEVVTVACEARDGLQIVARSVKNSHE
ncbi:MAG: tRNA (N(6)-L-threonylcarbamoyladenosine(37)-C(2))-methylthiotransferase MtaB [Alphaproteobacteria bacterium]|nr:tRNA (N(6)-L-threonylcarbamoyladenosine(37)-C(2))-methylthiotransferase MtaB [Alphaproteobacteria bacterium]